MTVAIPCDRCGAAFAAGHGALCPDCRPEGLHPGELRIPNFDPSQAIPLNDAARRQRTKRGLPSHPRDPGTNDPVESVKRLLEGGD